jgi:hypothetical protein
MMHPLSAVKMRCIHLALQKLQMCPLGMKISQMHPLGMKTIWYIDAGSHHRV